jgi:hypothetical protein
MDRLENRRQACVPLKKIIRIRVVFIHVHAHGEAQLVEVAFALGGPRAGLGTRERRQQHRGENADDGDDDEEFD